MRSQYNSHGWGAPGNILKAPPGDSNVQPGLENCGRAECQYLYCFHCNVICSGRRGSDKDISDLKNPLSNAEQTITTQAGEAGGSLEEGRLLRDQAGAELVVSFSHLLVFAPSIE